MEVNQLGEALKFMVLGMGVVFTFLVIMIEAMKLQAKLVAKYFPEEALTAPKASATAVSQDDEQARVAAVIAAVTEFRKTKS
jgi:oxaloacetate decarboxylase gamma subunit